MTSRAEAAQNARTWLTSLARDRRGNTLAIIAASIIPLAGMVGGGVDISRMYIVKTRLQHACDAGALAGRKMMGGGSWSANTYAARGEAERFFDANFNPNAYGTTFEEPATRRSFAESAGKVTGNARAVVPMTLMRIFGKTNETLTVTCDAEMRLPNTDVMFVLDTTGSMDYCPNGDTSCNGDANSRIAALRKAVKCFYQIVARLDVPDADCDGDEPTGGTGSQVQIRFGFVPYSTNVNVGKLLPNDYLVSRWTYQTRRPDLAVPPQKTETRWESYSGSITQSDCLSFMNNQAFGTFTPTPANSGGPAPAPTVVASFPSDGTATNGGQNAEWGWSSGSNSTESWGNAPDRSTGWNDDRKSCRRKKTTTTTYYEEKFASWDYAQFEIDVSGLKAGGSSWNNSFTMPSSLTDPQTVSIADPVTGVGGRDIPAATITWAGCIEERATTPTTDYDPIPSEAIDLDIDMVPNSDESRWRPALPRLIFTRGNTNGTNYDGNSWTSGTTSNWSTDPIPTSTTDYANRSTFFCPTEARKLQPWTDPTTFQGYVNSLNPDGNTYHDIGIIWGARLMSPTGIFKTENAATPNGGEIERHMIFMTDGDTNANAGDYAAYGLPFFDHRQTPENPTKAQLDEQVNLRFLAICQWVRNKNITLWVINFGEGQSQATQDRLEACASEGRYFSASDATALQTTFKSIADQISQLRLTK